MKRIFLVDDHPLLRDGLIRLIGHKSDWQVCGEAASATDAVESI